MRLSLLILLLSSTWASAHRIEVTVTIDATSPEHLQIFACYDDGTPVARAEAQLQDSTDNILSTVTLNDAGQGTLVNPDSRGVTVVVNDGTGHRATVHFEGDRESSWMALRSQRWLMLALGIGGIVTATFLAKRLNRMRHSAA